MAELKMRLFTVDGNSNWGIGELDFEQEGGELVGSVKIDAGVTVNTQIKGLPVKCGGQTVYQFVSTEGGEASFAMTLLENPYGGGSYAGSVRINQIYIASVTAVPG